MKRKLVPLCSLLSCIAFGAAASLPIAAHGAALSFTSVSGNYSDAGNRTIGWAFTAQQNLILTDLGFYDAGADGLLQAHAVGLYSDSGTLLVSGTVAPGTLAPLDGLFRYVSVAPSALVAGTTYVIGAHVLGSADQWVWTPSNSGIDILDLEVASAISIVPKGRYNCCEDLVLTFPSHQLPDPDNRIMYVGPNFDFVGTEVPLPALALFATGLAGLGWLARRTKEASRVAIIKQAALPFPEVASVGGPVFYRPFPVSVSSPA
jgi:hypothetical protein